MASVTSDPKPVAGRVDGKGRLVSADPQLERLQLDAGSRIGATLALPQLAGVARVAQRLRIPVARRVLAAGREQDVDMWVRAVPEGVLHRPPSRTAVTAHPKVGNGACTPGFAERERFGPTAGILATVHVFIPREIIKVTVRACNDEARWEGDRALR